MQRTAYIAIINDPLENALKNDVLILSTHPPQTPFVKVKITVTSKESRYDHERGKAIRSKKRLRHRSSTEDPRVEDASETDEVKPRSSTHPLKHRRDTWTQR